METINRSFTGDMFRPLPKVSVAMMNKAKKEAKRIKEIEDAKQKARERNYKTI